MVRALAKNVDCLLAETMSSFEEASQAVDAVAAVVVTSDPIEQCDSPPSSASYASTLPMMGSFSLNSEGLLRSGESAPEAVRKLVSYAKGKETGRKLAQLVNCLL